MLKDAIASLKLDRRLAHRRGWIDPAESAAALEGLPDVAEKGMRGEDVDAPEPGAATDQPPSR